jgi:hypothetical protein
MTSATVTDGGGGAAFDADWAWEWLHALSTIALTAVRMGFNSFNCMETP